MTTDKDLRFLSSCENEDLRVLCDILTHDRLGNIRVTEQLTSTDEYNSNYPEDMLFLVPQISNELLKYGSIIEDMGKATQVITESLAFPAYCALQYWNRMSEYSADRCAAAVVGEQVFQSALLKLTSGLSDIQGDPYQLVEQGKRYYEMKNASFFARVQQACREMFYSHPQVCQRAYEIDLWKSSSNYRTLIRENMPKGGLLQKE